MSSVKLSRHPDVCDRRLVFSINAGRSGSKYLAQLLGTAAGVNSFHEAEPKMSGEFIAMINAKPLDLSRDKRRIKAVAIAQTLRGMTPEQIYAETNHMFIKTFFDVVLEDFANVDVVVLRRGLVQVLKSFIELGYFSVRNPLSLAWMSSPNAATAAIRPLGSDSSLDQFDLCIAYLLDIEARALRFKEDYPAIRTHDVRIEQLNTEDEVDRLFDRLRLRPTAATTALVGRRANERQPRKSEINNPTTLEQCRERLHCYFDKASSLGIDIPKTIAFDQN